MLNNNHRKIWRSYMTQQVKKNSNQSSSKSSSSPKIAATIAHKETASAAEATRESAKNVVEMSSSAVKDFISASTVEVNKVKEKALEFSRDGVEKLSKSADVVGKTLYEAIDVSRDGVESLVECGNVTSAFAKDIGSELFEYANQAFADNVEISKEIFACRTINDFVELQSKIIKNSFDSFFTKSNNISNMLFQYSSEVLEPISERAAQASEKLCKTFSQK